ncbi:uncharacterized protein LOC112342188 [Selaginella moellendorffii]|uniref:uncharacterized protein LOC112342188 n=1 Tax=Selaginella moellendorffii TaxID=88036 RepID=UPI000D1C31D2|nr:uncharacterized protein LOC112342188 [Selaginella moellendorffii]|eukprot:XP_024519386.1 uncharacterized protein LOC112342188 [Selaginella moellendorffii]
MRLFDLSASLADLVLAWFLIRLGNDEEQSLDWLVYSEKKAMVDRHAGGRGQFENLLFFFFQNVKIFDPPSPERIEKICAWFYVLPKVEFRGIDITSAVRQILVHFIGARILRLSFGDHECLKHFIEDHSQIFHNFRLYLRSNIYNCHNVSALIGRLLFTWTRTSKGQRDHDELKELCKFTGNSFVEHVKSTLGSSNSCEDERQLLFRAAARVFGEDFSGQFVTLCANSQWEDNAKLLQTSELGEIMELAKQGQFQVANPLPKKVVTSSWLGEIILYLANLVLEDSMPYTFDRTTWIQDCRVLLIDPVINRQHMTLLLTSSRRKEGVYLAETVTKKICQELGAWIHSPKTVKKLEASLEDIDNALRDVMLRAAGGEFSDKHETLLAKMAKLLGFGKMDGMYGLARAYVLHGMPGKGGGDGHPNSKKSSSMTLGKNRMAWRRGIPPSATLRLRSFQQRRPSRGSSSGDSRSWAAVSASDPAAISTLASMRIASPVTSDSRLASSDDQSSGIAAMLKARRDVVALR